MRRIDDVMPSCMVNCLFWCPQASPGVFNENTFKALDWLLDEARRHGLRVILSFADNWKYPGEVSVAGTSPVSGGYLECRNTASPSKRSMPANRTCSLPTIASSCLQHYRQPYLWQLPSFLLDQLHTVEQEHCESASLSIISAGGVDEYVDWSLTAPRRTQERAPDEEGDSVFVVRFSSGPWQFCLQSSQLHRR